MLPGPSPSSFSPAPALSSREKSSHHTLRRRSEVDRRLDVLVGPSGRLKDASKQNIINVCDGLRV